MGKNDTGAQTPAKPRVTKVDKNKVRKEAADAIALAILQNPKANEFLYGNPLQAHQADDCKSVGEFLAKRSLALADDYLASQAELLK